MARYLLKDHGLVHYSTPSDRQIVPVARHPLQILPHLKFSGIFQSTDKCGLDPQLQRLKEVSPFERRLGLAHSHYFGKIQFRPGITLQERDCFLDIHLQGVTKGP